VRYAHNECVLRTTLLSLNLAVNARRRSANGAQPSMPRLTRREPRFEDSRDYVQSLARGLSVLRSFGDEHPRLSLAEIAARTQLSRAAARRLVLTLQHLGYVRGSGREFALSPGVLELGFGYLDSLKLTDLAQPLLEDLAHRTSQSSSMAVLDGQSRYPAADCRHMRCRWDGCCCPD